MSSFYLIKYAIKLKARHQSSVPVLLGYIPGAGNASAMATNVFYVAAKATYIRLLHGKIGILEGFFGPSSVHRGRTHIVLG